MQGAISWQFLFGVNYKNSFWYWPTNVALNFSGPLNPLSANLTKWSNTLKQFVGKLPTNCLSVFDHFVGLALKGLIGTKAFMQAQLNEIMPPQVPEILIAWKKAFLKFYFLYGITAKFWAIMFVKILMKIFRSVIFT